jgi:DNA-binding transcriptional regulator GbsR (MarR family)
MTEIRDDNDILPEPVRRFVLEWGSLGERWGVNRSVSQTHALLYASKEPMAAEQIADALGIAWSNVSNSLRELGEMLDFVDRVSRWYDQMIALPRSKITTLMKLGGGIARLLDRSAAKG